MTDWDRKGQHRERGPRKFTLAAPTFKQTLHWKGLTLEWMWLCCLSPEEEAKVLPHSSQAWARAPSWEVRMCRWRLLRSVKTVWQFSQVNLRECAATCRFNPWGLQYARGHCLQLCWFRVYWCCWTRCSSRLERTIEFYLLVCCSLTICIRDSRIYYDLMG